MKKKIGSFTYCIKVLDCLCTGGKIVYQTVQLFLQNLHALETGIGEASHQQPEEVDLFWEQGLEQLEGGGMSWSSR